MNSETSPASDGSQIRPATPADLSALSSLVVQLYAAELPGMLRGEKAAQVEVVRRLLTATPLAGRHVLERDSQVVASGSLATREAPRPSTPPGTLMALPSVLGVRASLATYRGVLRAMLTVAAPPAPDEAQIHSVVVDQRYRGEKIGARMMHHLEGEAVALGKRSVTLQVLQSNGGALAFYQALGYSESGSAHRRPRSAIAFPSVLMRKDLGPPARKGD